MFIIDISNLQDFAVGSYTRSFLASRSKYSKDHCPCCMIWQECCLCLTSYNRLARDMFKLKRSSTIRGIRGQNIDHREPQTLLRKHTPNHTVTPIHFFALEPNNSLVRSSTARSKGSPVTSNPC